MSKIMKTVRRIEADFDRRAESFAFHHPVMAFAAMFIGVPVFVLAAVCLCTAAVAYPVSLIMGWL